MQNNRGEQLIDFCNANDLVIGNTLFPHHPRRLYTWRSPGNRTRNQIDYIMIKKRWRTTLEDVKTRPSADCGGDHQLLEAKLKIHVKSTPKNQNKPIRYDVQAITNQFTIAIQNRFNILLQYSAEEATPNDLWSKMSETIKETATEYIP